MTPLWQDRPMPEPERKAMTGLAGFVWTIALVWNVGHVQDHLGQAGITGGRMWVLCWAPDVLLLVGVWKLRYRLRSVVAWLMVALGLAWLAWAGLSTVGPTLTPRVLAVAPIALAVLMTLALEFQAAPAPRVSNEPAADVEVRPATPTPVGDTGLESKSEAATVNTAAPYSRFPEPPAKAPTRGKAPAPAREAARQILMALDDFEAVSNADLARRHGGTDTYWRLRKNDLRAELAALGAEASTL